ncbi:MAG: iron-siderophore ABC transporter substrate-binding protein [Symploca sp. SIO3C6]|nr:iron-siderophore ABC transporter substrate-binding protein [Symploca sp. SIO3C6]
MISLIRLLVLGILTAFVIAACQGKTDRLTLEPASVSSSDLTDCRTIQHEMGETEVCGQPQRIVVLGPYVLEALLVLDIQPVGFSDHIAFHQGDYDKPNQQIPYLGERITQPLINVGLAESPSLEDMIRAKPDLILGTNINNNQYKVFSKIAPTLLLNQSDPEASLRIVAQAVNLTEQAEQLLKATEQQITSARETFAPLVATHPKVLLLVATQLQTMYLGISHESCSSPVEAMGFQLVSPPNFDKAFPDSQVPLSLETLPQLNDADLVILLSANLSELKSTENFEDHQLSNLKQAWKENAIAQSLDASKARRVYFIPIYLCAGLPGSIGTELYLNELEEQLLSTQ